MAARIVHGFGSGVCEALPVQLVNDIFFLHERGKRIGYYTSTSSFPSHLSFITNTFKKLLSVLVPPAPSTQATC
jgi:hypothetical protein